MARILIVNNVHIYKQTHSLSSYSDFTRQKNRIYQLPGLITNTSSVEKYHEKVKYTTIHEYEYIF